MIFWKDRKVLGIMALSAVMIGVVIVAGIMIGRQNSLSFQGDGYVLDITANEEEQSVAQVQFAENTVYRTKFPAQYKFRDIQGKTIVRDSNGFLHYADESLSAFADGMLVNMEEAADGLVDFFRIQQAMVMTNDGSWRFSIDNNGRELEFGELLWLLDEETMMTAASGMELVLAGSDPEPITGYLEIRYLEKDIVQVASRDMVWQSVAYNSFIRFASGAVLDLYEQCVEDALQNQLFSTGDLAADMKSGGIVLQSASASEWKPPVFNIQTEDGKDGKDGTDGTDGTDGAVGQDGQAGTDGTDGSDGTDGEDGKDGTDGQTGGQGAQGVGGAPGKGGGGAGTGGSAGGSGNTSSATNTLGTIRIAQMEYDSSGVDFTLTISDEGTLTRGTSRIEIRETETNRLVWYDDTVDLASGLDNIQFSCDTLNPDTAYTILVSNGYEVETAAGVFNSGTKTFVQRDFFTSSDGLSAQISKVTQDHITLEVQNQPYSEVKFYVARIKLAGEWYTTDIMPASTNNPSYDVAELLAQLNIPASDQEFEIEMYTTSLEAQNAAQAAFQEGTTDVYVGLVDGTVKKSKQVLTGKTLKQVPTFEKTTVRRTDQGSFEIVANPKDDPDSSVRGYRFEIYDPSNNLLSTLESTGNKAQWFYGALEPGTYTIKTVALWYDNEKNNEMQLENASVVATADGTAAFYFESYRFNDKDQYVDSEGNVIDDEPAHGVPATNETRIWGDLVFTKNGVRLDAQTVSVQVISSDNSYQRTLSIPINATSNDTQRIPVKLIGLKADTAYIFTVTAEVTYTVVVGEAETESKSTQTLGRVTVKMQDYAQSAAGSTVFGFSIGPADTNSDNDVVSVGWYNGNAAGYGTINSDPNYQRIRESARAIEFTVYDAGGAVAGKIVKDLYEDPIFGRDPASYGEAFEIPGIVQRAEIGAYYNGPLNNSWGNERIILTKLDFAGGGINLDNLRGKIRVAATALYDYSYRLETDFPEYASFYVADLDYNRIPLSTLIVDAAAGIYINEGVIDLDLQPPTLFDPAYEAISVAQIRNGLNNEVGYRDERLDSMTTVALKVQSNYRNYNNDTPSITYYAMTMDSFLAYSVPDGKDPSYDILKATDDAEYTEETGVIFSVTISNTEMTFSAGSVPPLYVVLTDDSEKLELCKAADGSPKAYVTGGRAIYYTNEIKRGNCYVFAFTLHSMYGVDTTVNEDPWVFPYQINEHGGMYYGDVQRSAGTEVLKQAPQARLYLDHTTDSQEVWKYYVYDPDKALTYQNGVPKIYAGLNTSVKNQINVDQKTLDIPDEAMLSRTVSSHQYLNYANANDRKVAQTSFSLNQEWASNSLSAFTLTISEGADGGSASWELFKQSTYEIWLANKLFDGVYTTNSIQNNKIEFIKSRADNGNGLWESELHHFALRTISHRFDYIEEDQIENLTISMKNLPQSEILDITLPVDNLTLVNHIVGVYYEIRDGADEVDDEGNITVKSWEERTLLQYGTAPCSTRSESNNIQISMAKLAAERDVWVRLWAVYDTGEAGINRSHLQSSIPNPAYKEVSASTRPAIVQDYNAVQQLSGSRLYASSETSARQLSYTGTAAAGSLYQIAVNNNVENPQSYMASYLATRRPSTNYSNIQMNFVYGAEGAVTADNQIPVFKRLNHAQVKLTAGDDSVQAVAGDPCSLKVTVPKTKPTITNRGYSEVGLHGGRASITLSEKSIQELLQTNPVVYEPRIYLELLQKPEDGAGDYFLLANNAGNQYPNFNWAINESNGSYAEIKTDGNEIYIDVIQDQLAYGIALRNLEQEKSYQFRAYCKDTDGNKVYLIDNSTSAGNDLGNELSMNVRSNHQVRIGDTVDVNSRALSAVYSQTGYGVQTLDIEYSLRGNYSLNSFEDLYIQYELQSSDRTYTHDEIMGWMGYTKAAGTGQWSYFDRDSSTWAARSWDSYVTTATQTPYQPKALMQEKITFRNELLNKLGSGNWKLQVRVLDKQTGQDVAYLDKDLGALSPGDYPTVSFIIPVKTNPLFVVQANSQAVTGSNTMQTNLTFTVQDSSFSLGAYGPGGTNIREGDCWIRIYEGNSTEPMESASFSGWQDFYHNGSSVILTFTSQPSIRYRVEIMGVRLENPGAEDVILETRTFSTPEPMAIELGTCIWQPYDSQLQTISMVARNAMNVELVSTASVTLSVVGADNHIKAETQTMSCRFVQGSSANMYTMTLSLTGLLERLDPEPNDLVDMTIAFYRDGNAEAQAQTTGFFTFVPQVG